MRRRNHKKTIAKLGLLFTVLLIGLASISMSYATWTDTITIEGTVSTAEDFNYLYLDGYWKFDEGDGQTAYDSSWNDNDGTVYGASWTSGKVDGALLFDGIDDYVQVPDDDTLDITDEITVMAWVKVNDYESGRFYTVAGKWNDRDGDYRGYLLGISTFDGNLQPRFYISSDGSNYPSAQSSINLNTGTWYHLAGTFDGSNLKIYVNGEEKGSYSYPASINSNNQPVLIGGDRAGGDNGRCFSGKIDEVKVYSCALTEGKIQYQAGLSP